MYLSSCLAANTFNRSIVWGLFCDTRKVSEIWRISSHVFMAEPCQTKRRLSRVPTVSQPSIMTRDKHDRSARLPALGGSAIMSHLALVSTKTQAQVVRLPFPHLRCDRTHGPSFSDVKPSMNLNQVTGKVMANC